MTESSNSRERRRAEVYRLLKEGIGEKMMIRRSKPAFDVLSRAYTIAKNPTPIFSPLFEIAAYRLANVIFRSARSETELREVDRLYIEASTDSVDVLGPMPLIHRVAVLHRLGLLRAPNDPSRDSLLREMESTYETACARARRESHAVSEGAIGGAHVQGRLHNLLELAAYFTDLDYEGRTSGLASPFEDLRLGDEWMILGTGGVSESVRWPKTLAEIEMRSRSEQGVDLMFELGSPRPRAKWRVWKSDGFSVTSGGRALLMLSQLCRKPSSDEELFSAVYGDGDFSDSAVRDTRRDLRDLLGKCLGKDGSELLPEVESGQPFQLKSDLRIVGMVSIDSLRVAS